MQTSTTVALLTVLGLGGGVVGHRLGSSSGQPNGDSPHAVIGGVKAPPIGDQELFGDALPATFSPQASDVIARAEAARSGGDVGLLFAALAEIENRAERDQAALELIGRLSAEQIGALFANSAALPQLFGADNFDGMVIAFSLVDRWVELDIDAAAEHALKAAAKEEGEAMIAMLAMAFISQRDLDRGRQLFVQMQAMNPEVGDDMAGVMFLGVGFDDPVRALRLYREELGDSHGARNMISELFELAGGRVGDTLGEVMDMPGGKSREKMLQNLFEAWTLSDPQAALDGAAALAEADGREEVLRKVITGMSERDPRAALASVDLLGEKSRSAATGQIVQKWAQRDATNALQWARANLDGIQFGRLVAHAAGDLDPGVGMELVASMSDSERQEFVRNTRLNDADHFIQRLAAVDPGAGVEWLLGNGFLQAEAGPAPEGGSRTAGPSGLEQAGDRLAQSVARADFSAAMDLLPSLPSGEFRKGFLGALAHQAAQSDPAAAVTWAQGLEGDERTQALESVGRSWASAEPELAAAWAYEQEDSRALRGALKGWSQSDPAAAYRWLIESHPDAAAEDLGALADASGLLSKWSRADPAAAAEAMLYFPEDMVPSKLAFVTNWWATEEPGAVSEFIENHLEPGPARDAAVQSLVGSLKDYDLHSAVAWARTISDEGTMHQVLESLATQ